MINLPISSSVHLSRTRRSGLEYLSRRASRFEPCSVQSKWMDRLAAVRSTAANAAVINKYLTAGSRSILLEYFSFLLHVESIYSKLIKSLEKILNFT